MNLMTGELYHKLVDWINKDTLIKFYKTKEWRAVRDKRRQLDNYECQECKRNGKYSKLDVVHHKQHVKDQPSMALMLSNTEGLCHKCHNKEHPEKLEEFNTKKNIFKNEERW